MKFPHVIDEGLRNYLEDDNPNVDYNTVANILNYTWDNIAKDYVDPLLSLAVVEQREEYFEDAEHEFGWRNLKKVHHYLRKVWST